MKSKNIPSQLIFPCLFPSKFSPPLDHVTIFGYPCSTTVESPSKTYALPIWSSSQALLRSVLSLQSFSSVRLITLILWQPLAQFCHMLLEFQKTWKVYKTGSLFSPDEIRCDSRLCLLGTSINNHHRNSFKLKLCSYGVYNGNGKTVHGNSGSDHV